MAKALTTAAIEKLKPDEKEKKRREIPDGLVPGLYFIVQPTGAKSWAVRYRYGNPAKPVKLTLGPYPAFDLAAARRDARLALQTVHRGQDPARVRLERRLAEAAKDDFGTVAKLFIERAQRPKRRSWQETARALGLAPDKDDPEKLVVIKGGLVARWGTRKLVDLSRRDIIAAIDDAMERGPYAANRTLAHLRTLFNWAMSRDLIAVSPCAGVEPPGEEKKRSRWLSDDELTRVWKACTDWPFGPITRLLILTGQRREEVAQMEWSEIDLDAALWTLPAARAKNNEEHEVPLSAAAVDIIKALPPRKKGVKLVFTTTGDTPVSGFSRFKDRLDEKTAVKDWRIHDIRRTVATGLAKLGVNLPVIEKVLNHASGSFAGIVGVYQQHSFADEKRAALDKWARHVMTLVEGKPAKVVSISKARA
jgi:integrase